MQMIKRFKSQKGAMTIYVTVMLLTFLIILTAVFSMAAGVRKNQLKTILQIKNVYERDVNNMKTIYEKRKM